MDEKDITTWQSQLFDNLTLYLSDIPWQIRNEFYENVNKLCLDHFKVPFYLIERMAWKGGALRNGDRLRECIEVMINALNDPMVFEIADVCRDENNGLFLLDNPKIVEKVLDLTKGGDHHSEFRRFLRVALREPKYFERSLRYSLNNYPECQCLFLFCFFFTNGLLLYRHERLSATKYDSRQQRRRFLWVASRCRNRTLRLFPFAGRVL